MNEQVKNRIETLIKDLGDVSTNYSQEKQYIGEAISMLRMLKDILDNVK